MARWVKAVYWSIDHIDILPVDKIRTDLFTHVLCAFGDLDHGTNRVVIQEYNKVHFKQFNQILHRKNRALKTLLAIGGGGGELMASAFAAMASIPASRAAFITSSIQVAREYGFDGLDLDYEFPKTQADMNNLGRLLSEWRAAVNNEPVMPGRSRLLLTAAVIYKNTNYHNPPIPYPAASIVANLDWINVMAYDFSCPNSVWGEPHKTQSTAQLYDRGNSGINSWLQANVPPHKIVLGIPFYGYAWKLNNPMTNGYNAPASGPTIAYGVDEVFYSRIKGLENYRHKYESNMVANYCFHEDTWISYDGVEAVRAKVNYVMKKGLLGYFGWQLAGDAPDFTLSNAAACAFDR